MSGGRFDYKQYIIADEVFGYGLSLTYGQDGFKQSKLAAKINPFHDVEMSEMFWDILVVLQSLDWFDSADTSELTYREDVEYFKNKWLGKTTDERINKMIDDAVEKARHEINVALGKEMDGE